MKNKKLNDTIYQMDYILCCLVACRGIIETGRDCNGCAAAAACKYRPNPGEQVRYNCPHYVEPKTEQNDSITCTNDSEKPNTSADHIAEADKMEPFARDRENGKDIIYRQDAIDALADAGIVNYAAGDGNGMLQAVNVIKALSPAQLPRMTDEDIQTIRIELSAVYESLCNQHRYREAKGYEGLIARFLTFAQDRPEPVKWLKDEFGSRCGACGSYAYRDKFGRPWESDYCPCCGARMDGE